jgi:GH24 family phage-related lysozyme (muramidase)
MENRFQEMDGYFARRGKGRAARARAANAPAISQSAAWVRPMSADQRVLVILIENGGIDLQIPRFVDSVIDAIPGSSLIPDSVRKAIRDFVAAKVNEPIRKASKDLLESAELLGNRYRASKPDLYGDVVVLQNGTASYEALKKQLIDQSRAGKIIDLFILTHGNNDCIAVDGCINGDRIRKIRAEYGKPLSIRSVYMMSCVGSTLNQPWRDIGAQVVSGTRGNNYLPEPTMFFFWSNWKAGNGFETAVTRAYEQTVALINDGLNDLLGSLVLPRIDVRNLPAIKESEPVVSGQGSIVIATDELDFSKSLAAAPPNGAAPAGGAGSVSPQGVSFIQRFEAFVAKPTADASGHCSVGYGTLLHEGACDGRASEQPYLSGIADDEARRLLTRDLAQVVAAVVQTSGRPLRQNQLDALASLVYSIGMPRFQRSRLARLLADGNFGPIADEIRKWTRARVGAEVVDLPGLVRRRSAEADLWQSIAAGQSVALDSAHSPVKRLSRPDAITEAQAMIERFRRTSDPGKWHPHLDRGMIADRLLALIANPDSLDQGANGLCGEAAFFNVWLWEDPLAVTRFAAQLYNGGAAAVGSDVWVRPGSSLRSQDINKILLQVRDRQLPSNWGCEWMLMSSLRDANNWVFSYDGTPNDKWGEGSSNGEVVRWLKATNLFSSVSFEKSDPMKMNPGGDAIVVVACDSHMLGNPAHAGGPEDNHFFVLRSAITEAGGTVDFRFWCWAEPIQFVNDRRADSRRVGTPLPGPLPKSQFVKEYFGHIVARRA